MRGAEPPDPALSPRSLRFVFTLVLGPPTTIAVLLALSEPRCAPMAVGLGGLLAGAWAAAGRPRARGALTRIVPGALAASLLLTPELVLRWAGFHHESGIEFANPRTFAALRADPQLFWTLPPGTPGVNSWGFPGPEIALPKPPGAWRLVFLGDSVMHQGYPARVARRLQERGCRGAEAVSLALGGYSSYQGRVLATTRVARLDSDVVVVGYGWNDHWLAYGAVDSEKRVSNSRWAQSVRWAYERLRVLQGLRWCREAVTGPPRSLSRPRVSLAQYADNLETVGRSPARGAHVLLLTAPTAHYARGVPDYLVREGFAEDASSVVSRHREYNDVVREVARKHGWRLLDLESEWEAAPDGFFLPDGIHLTERGLEAIAARVADLVWATARDERCEATDDRRLRPSP